MNHPQLSTSTDDFLGNIEALARSHFDVRRYPQHNMPIEDWELLMRAGVTLPALPKEYGGRDSHVEMCRLIERIAEHNLPVSMYVMIITAAVLRPIAMRGSEELKQEMLPLFARDPLICGFALTEPGCGTAMSQMTTTYEEVPGGYRIRGRKHWQGFSSTAHWWLVSAKSTSGDRKYGYFVVKRSEGFKTLERYNSLGMKAIDYGLNEIDAFVPKHRKITAEERNLTPVVEMLMPPRVCMAALASGFLRRIHQEAQAYTDRRQMGRTRLADIGFVKYRLKSIETSKAICEVLYHYLETELDLKADMLTSFFQVQAMKTLCTERMLTSTLHYQQLCGGEGYRDNSPTNIAGQAMLDARVFSIFDGTNDLLSQQLTEYCLQRCEGRPLSQFLATYQMTAPASAVHIDVRFLDREMSQAHLVLGGRALAAVFAIAQLVRYGAERGNAVAASVLAPIEFLKSDLRSIATEFDLLDKGVLGLDEAASSRSAPVISTSLKELTK